MSVPASSGRSLPLLLPSALALLLCAGFAVAVSLGTPKDLIASYRSTAERALAQQDYQTALVAAERLVSLCSPTPPDVLFALARANLGLGRAREALSLIALLAPPDAPTYLPAHLFVIDSLLQQPQRSPAQERVLLRQINNALSLDPESPQANAAMANYHIRRNNWPAAITCLRKLPNPTLETQRQIADLSAMWAADLAVLSPQDVSLRARVISEGLASNPSSTPLLAALLALADSPIESLPPSPTLSIPLAVIAWRKGDPQSARTLLASAKPDPNLLAPLLDSPGLEPDLRSFLLDTALELNPSHQALLKARTLPPSPPPSPSLR